MHFDNETNHFMIDDMYCDSEVDIQMALNIEKNDNQCMDMSFSDSNYVSEDSTICSDGFSDVKEEKETEESVVTIEQVTDHNSNFEDDMEKELINLNDMVINGDYWLSETSNDLLELDLNLNFETLKFSFIITYEHDLIKSLTNSVETHNPLNNVNLSPNIFEKNKSIIASTPIHRKTLQISESKLNTFILNKSDEVDGTILNNSQNGTFVNHISPFSSLVDSNHLKENILNDKTFERYSEDIVVSLPENKLSRCSAPFDSNKTFNPLLNSKNRYSMIETISTPSVNSIEVKNSLDETITKEKTTNFVEKQTATVNPKSRLSMIYPTVKLRQPLVNPSSNLPTNEINRKSSLIKPKIAPPKSIRHSMAAIPQSPDPQTDTRSIPATFTKPRIRPVAPSQISVLAKPKLPIPSQLLRPNQLKFQQREPFLRPPKPSESVPIVSPSIDGDDNPLSRTFDKSEFQLLKSVTNIECNNADHGVPSVLDCANNNLTVYRLARTEEENLIGGIVPPSGTVRGTNNYRPPSRLPSKIQSRIAASQKR